MNQREKIMVIITAVIVGGLLAFHFLADTIGGALPGDAGQTHLAAARADLEGYIETMHDAPRIRAAYEQLPMAAEGNGDAIAEEVFNRDLIRLFTDEFGISHPELSPPKFDLVPDVDDYYLVGVRVSNLSGPAERMIHVLRELERMGLIITDFRLQRSLTRADDVVNLDLDVARLIRHDERSRQRLSYLRRSR